MKKKNYILRIHLEETIMKSNETPQGGNKAEKFGNSSQKGSNVPTQPTVPPMPKPSTPPSKK
jgi:hypothetical protein